MTIEPDFKMIETNGIRLRVALAGPETNDAPLVILAHGFPESWYSWRHQIGPLAEAGYRVAAPDMRGYGGSDRPQAVEAYSLAEMTADMAGLANALSPDRSATIIGHDWGAPIAWQSALRYPDIFGAVAGLSIPYRPPGPKSALQMTKEAFIDRGMFFYLHYFQEPGVAEAELEGDVARAIRTMYYGWSGDAPKGYWHNKRPPSSKLCEGIDPPPEAMPDWFTPEDEAYYVGEFERTGFAGALGRYRNFERDHADMLAIADPVIHQPSLFIAGTSDPALSGSPEKIEASLQQGLGNLHGAHFIERIGHWTQQEAPDEINRLLLDWLADVVPTH